MANHIWLKNKLPLLPVERVAVCSVDSSEGLHRHCPSGSKQNRNLPVKITGASWARTSEMALSLTRQGPEERTTCVLLHISSSIPNSLSSRCPPTHLVKSIFSQLGRQLGSSLLLVWETAIFLWMGRWESCDHTVSWSSGTQPALLPSHLSQSSPGCRSLFFFV